MDVRGHDEIGQLGKSFNQMTVQLVEQRERLVQVERVAAWRELARRLAHELKNPLFPLQTTVENLQRAREQDSPQFDEVFRESTGIMLSEIENLKAIVSRFSDFAKMPQPELAPVNLNEIVAQCRQIVRKRNSVPWAARLLRRNCTSKKICRLFRPMPLSFIAPSKTLS